MTTKVTHTSARAKKNTISQSISEEFMGIDIIEAIKEDHKDLKKHLKIMKDKDSSISEKDAAYKKFSVLLKSHAPSEEKALYAKCIAAGDMGVETNEAYVEHQLATLLMKSIDGTKDSERRAAQIKVLAESVEHHIEEEEGDFLPGVKKEFGEEERIEMAAEFLRLRRASQKKMGKENAGVLGQSLH